MVTLLLGLFIIVLDLQSHEVFDLSGVGGIFREAFGGYVHPFRFTEVAGILLYLGQVQVDASAGCPIDIDPTCQNCVVMYFGLFRMAMVHFNRCQVHQNGWCPLSGFRILGGLQHIVESER